MIEIRDVVKTFDGFRALDGVTMTVPRGAVYGLVGPNGAGKSTLIRHLTGIYRPDSGVIDIDGQPVYENPAVKARIAYIPDDVFYFPQATIPDMMRYYRGIYPKFDAERYQKLGEVFQLDPKRQIRRLSKGMQKQAAFWLAMCLRPDVLVLDEPVDWLSPLVLFMRRTSISRDYLPRPISGTGAEAAVNSFSGWTYPLVWAAFALLLLVCAGQLYRRRRMESAGDTVAIPVLKPVLKYIVALFAGLAMPVGVYGMLLNVPAYRTHLVPFLLLAVLGAALGFVISEMVIRKSLRIPRTVWRGCAVTAAVCCLVVVGAKCDLMGYARRIPDTAQVKSARIICNGYNSTFSEAENIQAVEDLHRAVVTEREKITDDTSITSLQLTYKLSNGKVLMREYTLPNTSTRLAQIEQVLNCDEARTTRNTPELAVTLEHLTYTNIGYETESGDYLYMELTAEQALDLYENAIVPDCADGTMGRAWLTDSGTRQSTAYAVTIGYQLSQYDPATGETTYANVNYTPLTGSTRTLAWLRAHDIKPLLEGDSIKYGGEPDTQPATNTYETADSSIGR